MEVGALNGKPAEVNGKKPKSLRCGRAESFTDSKRAGQGCNLTRLSKPLIGIFRDDFAAVDVREDYATIADPKKQIREALPLLRKDRYPPLK